MNNTTWKQATNTLRQISDQNPELPHIRILHDGYLSAIMEAIVSGKDLPEVNKFRYSLGLDARKFMINTDYTLEEYHPVIKQLIEDGSYDVVDKRISSEVSFKYNVLLPFSPGLKEARVFDFDDEVSYRLAISILEVEDYAQQPLQNY